MTMTLALALRSDVLGCCLQLDGDRWADASARILGSRASSSASFMASSKISQTMGRETTTVSWSGGGGNSSSPGNPLVMANGLHDWTARRRAPRLPVTGAGAYPQRALATRTNPALGTVTVRDVTVRDVTEPQLLNFFAPLLPMPPLELAFMEGWNLLAGSYVNSTEAVTPMGQPTQTISLGWPAVGASCSPIDDNYGGV